MPNKTTIEWTDLSSNPIRARRKSDGKTGWYCQKTSQGCSHCYAERRNNWIGTHIPFSVARRDEVEIVLDMNELNRIAKIPAGKKVFICDMTDLFGEFVPDEYIYYVFKAMTSNPWVTFLVLTKRGQRMSVLVPKIRGMLPDRLNHVWLGVSACNQKDAEAQIPSLIATRATVHFVSLEPLLSPIRLHDAWLYDYAWGRQPRAGDFIDWVIVGGESGPKARPMHPDWARSLRDQCQEAGIPYFFKQWGEWALKGSVDAKARDFGILAPDGAWYHQHTGWNGRPIDPDTNEAYMIKVGKKAAGCLLDGKEWKQFPEG